MRVLFTITRGDDIGGAQRYVQLLAQRMQQEGHGVMVATGVAGDFTALLESQGISWSLVAGMLREIDPLRDIGAVRALMRTIRAFRSDLVSAHSSKAGIIARIAARRTGTPAVFTAHGWAFTDGVPRRQQTIFRTVERIMAPLADRIICVSEYDRRLALAHRFPADRLVTIHNGIPDRPSLPAGDPPERLRVVMTARFAPQKQPVTLLKAIAPIDECECWLIGDGPGLDEARAVANDLGITDRVRFVGRSDDVPSLLAQCQIFALSSDWEGFPIATLEAMRAGLPVIVTDVGGTAEAIVEGVSGFAVPRRDAAAMGARIRQLVESHDLRMAMGDAARARFLEQFTFDEMYRRTIETYEAAIARRNR